MRSFYFQFSESTEEHRKQFDKKKPIKKESVLFLELW